MGNDDNSGNANETGNDSGQDQTAMGQAAGADATRDNTAMESGSTGYGQVSAASAGNDGNSGSTGESGDYSGQDQNAGMQGGSPGLNGGNPPATAGNGSPGATGGGIIYGTGNVNGGAATPDNTAGSGDKQVVVIGADQGSLERGENNTDSGGGSGSGSLPAGAKTGAEKIAVLDEKLGQFDGMILGKRQAVIKQDNQEGSGTSATGTGTGDGSGQSEGNAKGAPLLTTMAKGSASNSGSGNMPAMPGKNRQGDYEHTQATADIPPDIPDGSDDDVVARQLREAAMKETDPKLRARLWDEYRKYKKGVVGKP